jgi:hypothetical protein
MTTRFASRVALKTAALVNQLGSGFNANSVCFLNLRSHLTVLRTYTIRTQYLSTFPRPNLEPSSKFPAWAHRPIMTAAAIKVTPNVITYVPGWTPNTDSPQIV